MINIETGEIFYYIPSDDDYDAVFIEPRMRREESEDDEKPTIH